MSTIAKVFISIGIVAFCAVLFVSTYLLNKHTKKPEGCEELDCEGCGMLSCSKHPKENKTKEN